MAQDSARDFAAMILKLSGERILKLPANIGIEGLIRRFPEVYNQCCLEVLSRQQTAANPCEKVGEHVYSH